MSTTIIRVANTSTSLPPSPSSFTSSITINPLVSLSSLHPPIMKDTSTSSVRNARNQAYPKKRPTLCQDGGIQKSRCKDSPTTSRRTPVVLRAELLRIKRREAQLAAFLKEGIYVEEEYRDEICFYMHEMEVSTICYSSCFFC